MAAAPETSCGDCAQQRESVPPPPPVPRDPGLEPAVFARTARQHTCAARVVRLENAERARLGLVAAAE